MEEFAASLSDTCVRRRQGTRKHEGLRLILVLQQRGKRCEMWSFYATSQSDKNLAISVLSQFEFALPPRSRSRTWRSIIQPISRINLVACPEILRQHFLCPNLVKNNFCAGTNFREVSLSDFVTLQQQADTQVGGAAMRNCHDRSAVRFTGYLMDAHYSNVGKGDLLISHLVI
jgi:hypothetical protein